MIKQHETIVFNFKGGIISPGYLHDILDIVQQMQVSQVRFGSRQQLFAEVPVKLLTEFTQACHQKNMNFSLEENSHQNIISSYAATSIFINESWLSEGVYKDIFDQFDFVSKLKLNICDRDQTFVPFFTGHINWIASDQSHFWYLYIRLPKTNKLFCYPELVYTNDLVYVTKALEKLLLEKTALFYEDLTRYGQFLHQIIKSSVHPITKSIEKELDLPLFHLPYYEGFNKHGNAWWLGIYRRNELFSVSFLKDICRLCLETKIGELYATPWKSIIIKGIATDDPNRWDFLLGKYRINVRHAANELNWQVEDNNEDGLVLKRHVIRYFDKEDVRTYGLCFAVKTQSNSGIFGSVIIRRQGIKSNKLKSQERYQLLYTPGFNPNSSEYILFRDQVEKEHLGTYLVWLCKLFYESKAEVIVAIEPEIIRTNVHHETPGVLYQCKHCLTVYDPLVGDPTNGVPTGTDFNDLPANYECPLCESTLEDFKMIAPLQTVLKVL